MTLPPDPFVGIALVAVLFSLAVGLAAVMRKAGWVSGELARKSVHVLLGLVVATFPWLFTDYWPVWLIAGLAVAGLAAVRWVPALRSCLGGSLHDVERQSWGEFCFPLAIAIAWTLMPGDWIRFSLPVLVLAVSDAVAALVGRRYGQTGFSTAGGRKSWEGSLAFAGATFLVVHVPLLLATPIGRAESLLIAMNMALLLMLVEGLAWEGFDNLFIPIAGLLLIDECYGLPFPELVESSLVMLGLTVGCWWWRHHTTLDDAAVLACAVLGYVQWSAGGWPWLVAPGILFGFYTWLYPPRDGAREQRALIPISIVLPGLVWLLVDTRNHGDPRWVIAAAGTYALHLAAIGMLGEAQRKPAKGWFGLLLGTWIVAVLATIVPTALVLGRTALMPALAVGLGAFCGLVALWAALPDRRSLPMDERRWLRQSLAALAGSTFVLLVPG